MRITLLGTGTSTGVPVIGCHCPVCSSPDPRNKRLRPGALVELPAGAALIDTPTDLRQQALVHGIERVDAVVYTHSHADHILGLDEIRVFNFRQQAVIPCYGPASALANIRRTFAYSFEEGQEGGGKPKIELLPVAGPFTLLGVEWVPVPVRHGTTEVFGYRLGPFAYVTDVSFIPEESFALLAGVDTLVLGALRFRPHSTHFSIPEAIAAAQRIGARRTLFTHLAHEVDHTAPREPLPPGVELAHDGLAFDF
ncbi:MAG TPA: MBL fold metallo-hydrolase [Thermoanaerobaculia bacterium]|nr:MBL fold metallo-hydrolase [Thermoanaerobaculia bacterium]